MKLDSDILLQLIISIIAHHSVKGPELINMYVGQSEQNIREGLSHPSPGGGYKRHTHHSVCKSKDGHSMCNIL